MEHSADLDRFLARRFQTYDRDGDGHIQREDFTGSAEAMAAEFGLAEDDPRRVRLLNLVTRLWGHLSTVADTDFDGQISLEEYRDAFALGLLETPETFEAGYVPFLDTILEIADTDEDGRIDKREHLRWTGALMGIAPDIAGGVFDHLDADDDGYVGRGEILAAIRACYFDDGPDSARHWMLGPLE
ncbi:hypothetical protein Afil01_59060 [Actinorhabdospora filicis]|uniref:EF-hand domain-containing protein n=1 Tax=Actinorhabdospora filicis TaxID=1785913 RepID=A0A9W6SSE2_9ACTN|nr:EF-hand domain-containing protein [Actinorhabdospora filicis]GLZ81099.1 hypothetical protein Afil01_59060 [Actinorhabdospora filicis]